MLDPGEVPAGSTFEADATLLVRAMYERKADGELLSVDDVYAMPPDPEGDAAGQWIRQRFTRVQLRLMGDQLDAIQVREAALLGGLLILTLGATFVVVERREPS